MNPNQGTGPVPGQNPQDLTPGTPSYSPRQNADLSVPPRTVNVPARDLNLTTSQTQPLDQPQPLPVQPAQEPYVQAQSQAPTDSPSLTVQSTAIKESVPLDSQPQIAAMPQLPTYQPDASPSQQPEATPLNPPVRTPTISSQINQSARPQYGAQAPQPVRPAPTQQLPPQPQEALAVPMPADVLPPQQVPAVPTLAPTAQQLNTTNPPKAQAQANTWTAPTEATPTASFSTQPASHVPADISARIAETPMQNSSDINKKNKGFGGKFKGFASFIVFMVSVIAAAFLINQFIFQSYYVEGTSMTPTLQNNDRLIISKVERSIALATGQPYIPQRGQIVILDSSLIGPNGQHEQLIKRVVGLPGERVHIENGTVTIFNAANPDGVDVTQELDLTYLKPTYTEAPIDTTIPAGQVYVMGDNRGENGSYDSRAFGPVESDKIHGRLWARVLPLDKAQIY